MQLYSRMGNCSNGYYKSFDGFSDLQSCLKKCVAENECLYVSFMDDENDGKTCKGYKSTVCNVKFHARRLDVASKGHTTYQKIPKCKYYSLFECI